MQTVLDYSTKSAQLDDYITVESNQVRVKSTDDLILREEANNFLYTKSGDYIKDIFPNDVSERLHTEYDSLISKSAP